MARLHYEHVFDAPIADVFVALVRMLALRRWDPQSNSVAELSLPRTGCSYAWQTSTALREGKVIEVIRPVSITLVETLHDPPCRVALKQRWRIHSLNAHALLQLELDYRLNQAATLRQFHWRQRLDRHCAKMITIVVRNLDWQQPSESADSLH